MDNNNKSKEYGWDVKKGLTMLNKKPTTKTNKPKSKKDELKEILKKEIMNMLTEEVTYNFPFKNKKFKIRFDVNANPTKKGLKIQFIPTENLIQNPDEARQLMNELQIYLNEKLGSRGLTADFDPDVPYQNVIGFTVKLGSIASMLVKILGGSIETPEQNNSVKLNSPNNEKTKID